MSERRHFMLPAIETAARRMTAVLVHQRRIQRAFNFLTGVAVVVVAYTVGHASVSLVVLVFLSGAALGSMIRRLRAFGENYRATREVAALLPADEAQAMWRASRERSRAVVRSIVLTLALAVPAVAFAAHGAARAVVVAPCIIALGYLRSSIKAISPGAPDFENLTETARAAGCRIALFRSFEQGPSRLTGTVLIPVLSGYGKLDVVFDQTLDDVEDQSFLGEDAKIERFATLHRFENAEWRDGVAALIDQTDVAVIEATRLTPGVTWELANCLRHLPPWRVYLVINLEVLHGSVEDYLATFYERVGHEADMPRDVRPRFFLLGEGGNQAETIALDVHAKMVRIAAIESGDQDASAFGPGAARWT